MIPDPGIARISADLQDSDFLSGSDAGRWRVISFAFPVLDFAISATDPDGTITEYGFRAELSNYPAQPPLVRIWDHDQDTPLSDDCRPIGGPRVQRAFQHWGADTVYRPWDRKTGSHNNNAASFPHLAWRPERTLAFFFEDLYGILNSNARAPSLRTSTRDPL